MIKIPSVAFAVAVSPAKTIQPAETGWPNNLYGYFYLFSKWEVVKSA